MDLSIAGVLSRAEEQGLQAIRRGELTVEDLCCSMQETIFAMLVEVTERAMAHSNASDVLIVGGVGCNRRLQDMMTVMCSERSGRCYGMDSRFAIDNGAMIAQAGILAWQWGQRDRLRDTWITQRFRTDEVEAVWRSDDPPPPPPVKVPLHLLDGGAAAAVAEASESAAAAILASDPLESAQPDEK